MLHPNHRPQNEGLIICDYGSQYTLLIARRLRESGIYCEIIDGDSEKPPEDFNVHGIILSGGPDSVLDEESRGLADWVLESKRPVLGICYGMQLLVENFGGEIRVGKSREYGRATLHLAKKTKSKIADIFAAVPTDHTVWMSHGDDMHKAPDDFEVIALTDSKVAAAIAHKALPIMGLQYHPEVPHTEYGGHLLEKFATDICKAPHNWHIEDMIASLSEVIKETVGDGNVLVGCSGGVDSSVASVLLSKVLGPEKVTGVFIDNGLLRKNEVELVSKSLRGLGLHLEVLHMADDFLNALTGESDPEKKRKTIGYKFIEGFEKFAKQSNSFTHLGQGTLYPDVIESAGHGSGSKVIKSHHNVGGLPEKLHLDLIEPFRFLFKDEVRKIGLELGLPEEMIFRHPFPGPGLGIRIPGAITKEKVKILQEADHLYIEALRKEGYYDKVWQAATILLPVKSVGVMGDNRTYQWTCVLRAVDASDGMTANASELPHSFLSSLADQIVRKVDGINRVLYDVTGKPPATIEWE